MWKYGRSAVEGSEFLLDSALIEMMEYNEDIFAAGNKTRSCYVQFCVLMYSNEIQPQYSIVVVFSLAGMAIRPKNRRIPDSIANFLHSRFGFQFLK